MLLGDPSAFSGSPLHTIPNRWSNCLLGSSLSMSCLEVYFPRVRRIEEGFLQKIRMPEGLSKGLRSSLCSPLGPGNSSYPILLSLFILLLFWLFSPQGLTHLLECYSDNQENKSGFNVCWLQVLFQVFFSPNYMIPNSLSSHNRHINFTRFWSLPVFPGWRFPSLPFPIVLANHCWLELWKWKIHN